MWFEWLHNTIPTAASQRPVCWWRQIETSPRMGMPFAHLFPRPPARRSPAISEAERLVRELVRTETTKPLEEIVQRHQRRQTESEWQPVEAHQVVSIERLNDHELAAWGGDAGQVVEWFDKGDLASWPTSSFQSLDPEAPAPRGIRRVTTWFRGFFPKQMELAGEH